MGITAEQYKEAARKAYASGDVATARSLLKRAEGAGGATVTQVAPPPTGMTAEQLAYQQARASGQMPAPLAQAPEQAARQGQIDAAAQPPMMPAPQQNPQDVGAFGAFMSKLAPGMSFGFADEAAAGIGSLFESRTYDEILSGLRKQDAAISEQYPKASLAGEITGAVALPGVGGAKLAAQAPTLGGKMGIGALIGGGQGGLYGFGTGEGGAGNRFAEAIPNAIIGAGLGFGIPAIGAGAQYVTRAGKEMWANGQLASQGAKQLGVSPRAAKVLSETLSMENPAEMTAAMNRAGPNAMLADGAPGIQTVLDSAMRSPGRAARIAAPRIDQRVGEALTGVNAALDGAMGAPGGIKGAQASIRSATAPARKAAYEAAYAAPIDYASDAGMKLEGLVSRLPGKAISYANELMRLNGEQSAQIMAKIGDDGTVAMERMPDVRQWDYIKQALDQLAESGDGAGAMGGQTRLGSAYQSLSRTIRDGVAESVPEYKTALEAGADTIQRVQGIKAGTKLLGAGTTREDVAMMLDGATGPERSAIMSGVRQQIDDTLARVRAVGSDPNVDAREAQSALSALSSRDARDKLKMLLGDQWPAVEKQLDQGASALGLRARTAANSATAGRLGADQMINDSVDPSALRQGKPFAAIQEILGSVMGSSKTAVNRLRGDAKADVADVLTRPGQGPQIMALLESLGQKNAVDPQSGSAISQAIQAMLMGQVGMGADRLKPALLGRAQ